jgi:hypothetical protein
MPAFKKTPVTAKAKAAKAEIAAFTARAEAMAAILEGAPLHDVLLLCVQSLAEVAPPSSEAHLDAFKAEFLRVLSDCLAMRQEQDAAEAEADAAGDEDGHLRMHSDRRPPCHRPS